mgnify:CR=1 FL=1
MANKAVQRFKARVGTKSAAEVDKFEKDLASISAPLGDIINRKIVSAIEKAAGEPVQLSWLPTDTARSSIFSPIADRDLDQLQGKLVFRSSWGILTVHGPPLNVTDESVFLALLHFVRKEKKAAIKVNYRQICKTLGLSYQTKNIRRIKKAIKNLALTSLDFELKDGTWAIRAILQSAKGVKDYSTIEIDPWFFSKFLANEITMLDLKFRQSLKGYVVKCLYRFLSSHRGPQSYRIETLIMALNMNPTQELKYHTRALMGAFSQLRNKKFLTYKFKAGVFSDIKIL